MVIRKAIFTSLALTVILLLPCKAFCENRATSNCLVKAFMPLYGRLNQLNPRLKEKGLFSFLYPDRNALCGETCFANALTKLRAAARLQGSDPVSDIEVLFKEIAPALGKDKVDLREMGLWSYELKDLIGAYLEYIKIPGDVSARGVHASRDSVRNINVRQDILVSDLLSTKNKDEAVILNIGMWKENSIDQVNPSSLERWIKGHYVVLESINPTPDSSGAYSVVINDPGGTASASKLYYEKLEPVKPKLFGSKTFRLQQSSQPADYLITGAIKIKLRAPRP